MNRERIKILTEDGLPLTVIPTEMVTDVQPHRHDYIEIVIFLRGSAVHTLTTTDGKTSSCTVMQGDCFAILPEECHSFSQQKSGYYYNLIFSRDFLLGEENSQIRQLSTWGMFFGEQRTDLPMVHMNFMEQNYLADCLRNLSRELALRRPGYNICAKFLAMNILVTILRKDPLEGKQEISGRIGDNLLRVINELERCPEKPMTLEQMARSARMCVSSFTRAMRTLTGCSPMKYVIALRLQKAAGMLAETSCTVEDIATNCGFCDANYLVKCFRAHYGITPGEFRRRREYSYVNKKSARGE